MKRPHQPSYADIAKDLGIPQGPGYRKLVEKQKDTSPLFRQYVSDLAAFYASPEYLKQKKEWDDIASKSAFRYAEKAKAEAAEKERVLALWKSQTCRWKRDGLPAKTQAMLTFASNLATIGKLKIKKSDRSRTKYVYDSYHFELRISDHELGHGDYGTRKQFHKGPEMVFDKLYHPLEAVDIAIQSVRDFASVVEEPGERQSVSKILVGLAALRRRYAGMP